MNTIIHALCYADDVWRDLTLSGKTIAELRQESAVIYIEVETGIGTRQLVDSGDLAMMDQSTDAETALKAYVPTKSMTEELELLDCHYKELSGVAILDGVAFIREKTPLVFNYHGGYQTSELGGRYLIPGLTTNINLNNDVAIGTIAGIEDFYAKPIAEVQADELHAALLYINGVVAKLSDYFDTTGNTLRLRTNRTEALMGLLVEAGVVSEDLGVIGGYKQGALASRNVHSRVINANYIQAIIHPHKVPIEFTMSRVPMEFPVSTPNVIFLGNKPSTARALGVLKNKPVLETSVVSSQGCIRALDEDITVSELSLRYPRLPGKWVTP